MPYRKFALAGNTYDSFAQGRQRESLDSKVSGSKFPENDIPNIPNHNNCDRIQHLIKALITLYQESEALELYNKGLALQQKGDYVASEEAYNQLLNSALVKEVSTLIFKMVF